MAPADMTVPVSVPQTFDEHIKLQFDLLALAFQADITRVGTLLFARDLTGRTYPECEAPGGFHGGSHHGEPAADQELSKIASITSRWWRLIAIWPRPRTATARCWIIRSCSAAT